MSSKKTKDMLNFLLNCSLPEDHKPIQEYIEAKENPFFRIVFYSSKKYFRTFLTFGSILFFSFFFFLFFTIKTTFSNYFFNSFYFTIVTYCIFLISLVLRWNEINNHFSQSHLFYEESSWFDTQIWEKPFFLLKSDKLVSFQKIRPILQRLFLSFSSFFFSFLILFLVLIFEKLI